MNGSQLTGSAAIASTEPTRSRGHYRKGIQRRAQIINAAADIFGEFGYSGGSIRAIAERVGVSPATLIQYFGSKEGLLAAVLEDWQEKTRRLVVAADLRGLAYIDAYRELMAYHVEHRGLIELFLTMGAEASSESHPARTFIRTLYAKTRAEICDRLAEAVMDGDIAPLSESEIDMEARLLIAVMDGIELQWLLDPDADPVALLDRYLDPALDRWRQGLRKS